MTDPLDNVFQLQRDVQSRLTTLLLPLAATPTLQQQRYEYDAGSRLNRYELLLRSEAGGLIESTTLAHDARGKLLQSANANGGKELRTAAYSGLGYVVASSQTTTGTNQLGNTVVNNATTTYRYAPLGNSDSTTYQSSSSTPSENSWSQRNASATYDPVTGRLVRVKNGGRASDIDTLYYDASGNRIFQTRSGRGAGLDRASFYAADGRLLAVDARTLGDLEAASTIESVSFDEYRYDALGRRIRTRNRNWCGGTNNDAACSYDFTRRTVWDGAHTLGQIRMPDTGAQREWDGFPVQQARLGSFDPNPHLGQVIYTRGLGIDQPLSAVRMGYGDHVFGGTYSIWTPFAVLPLWDPEGGAPYAVFSDGKRTRCLPNSTRCLGTWWRLAWLPYAPDANAFATASSNERVWLGNVPEDRQDASGLLYRRNRYYDPGTGQFTQEDPIGLAGGMNLYGFAGGDPVNFSDPFGLCPEHITGIPCIPEAGSQGIESVGTGPWDWVSPRAAIGIVRGAGKVAVRRAIASETGEAIASGFARWSFRRNLTREIGEVAGAEAHHIFPHALKGDFARIGIDVNNPRFGAWWGKTSHRQNASAYNRTWETWFSRNRSATRDEGVQFGRDLGRRYGFEARF